MITLEEDETMIDANVLSNISCRCVVDRKIHTSTRVIQLLLYFSVFVFVVIGMYGGFLWLIPTLGTLFFAWYFMGEHRVSYEYQLDGYDLVIRRLSGSRFNPINIEFAHLDLRQLIVISDQFTPQLGEGETLFNAAGKENRVTYYTSAQDPDKPSCVLYAHGIGAEEGMIVRVYLQPSSQLLYCLNKLCPDKVFTHADLI